LNKEELERFIIETIRIGDEIITEGNVQVQFDTYQDNLSSILEYGSKIIDL